MRFWIGFFTFVPGIVLIIFSRKIFENFGRIAWAEDKLGPTGTLTLLRLIGVALILFGIFIWTGLFDLIFGGIFRTLFKGVNESIDNQTKRDSSQIIKSLVFWLHP